MCIQLQTNPVRCMWLFSTLLPYCVRLIKTEGPIQKDFITRKMPASISDKTPISRSNIFLIFTRIRRWKWSQNFVYASSTQFTGNSSNIYHALWQEAEWEPAAIPKYWSHLSIALAPQTKFESCSGIVLYLCRMVVNKRAAEICHLWRQDGTPEALI